MRRRRGRPRRRRPRTGEPGSSRAGDERVVAALAVRPADRVDRRHVEHVEAELGELRDLLLDALRARPRSAGTPRTRSRSGRGRGRPRARAAARAASTPWRSALRSTAAYSSIPSAASCLAASRISASAARASAWSISLRSAPLARPATSSSSSDALAELARHVVLAGLELALAARRARWRRRRSRPRSRTPSGRARSTTNAPPQRTPLICASSGCSSASCHLRAAVGAVEDDGAQLVVAVAEHVGASPRRGRRRCAWPGSGRRPRSGPGTGCGCGAAAALASRRQVSVAACANVAT